MSDEQRDDERMRGLLGRSQSVSVPQFDALHRAPTRSPRRSIAVTLATVIVAVAALYAGRELSTFRQQQASPTAGVAAPTATAAGSPTASAKVVLPPPIPQPITRTSPAAQVAWVSTSQLNAAATERLTMLVGVDPSGRIVGRIDGAKDPGVTRARRSADGAVIVTIGDSTITAYSALDGTVQRTYTLPPNDFVADTAFSPDGRWLALIGAGFVEMLDLRTGLTQTAPLSRPATATNGSGSTLLFAPDSKRLYTIVDWSSPRITAFDVTPTGLTQTAAAIDGQGGKTFPGCGGPGLAPKIVGGGQVLVLYCHVDGAVGFVDLPTLTTTTILHAEMKNPFWLAPIYTPDGQLLYLHQYPAFGDQMQVVDLRTHALLGPVPTPTKTDQPGPFSWLFPIVYAGGTPSTVPVSPDGLKLYAESPSGITVLRVPDLTPLAKLAAGINVNEVWISGDGKTVYGVDSGKGVYAVPEAGGQALTVTLPSDVGGFIASEHG
jgi:hypothetical protein